MKWQVVLIFLYFRYENATLSEGDLYVFCGCPFGYFQVTRFDLSSETSPPNCTENKNTLRTSKKTLEGYKCRKCHPSCLGCHGATDGDCNQCANDYLRASSYVQQKTNNSHALGANGGEITAHGSEMKLKKREKRQVDETRASEYKLDEIKSIDKDLRVSDDVLQEFGRDVNEDYLLTLDPTKQEQSSSDGEYDLGSGDAEQVDSTGLKGSLKSELFSTDSFSTPREVRSTETILPNNDTDPIDIYEKVIFTPATKIPLTIRPTTKQHLVRKRTTSTTTTTTQSTTTTSQMITTTTSQLTSPTTLQSTTNKATTRTTKVIRTTVRPKKPKTKKPLKTTTTQSPAEEAEFSNFQANFWCVSSCPEGSYADEVKRMCLPCDSKCMACVGPSFMNCTACASNAVRVSAVRKSPGAIKNLKVITCLSNCPMNEFDKNGTCTLCHNYCNGCLHEGITGCIKCKYSRNEEEDECSGPESDPLSALEIILPIVFVLFLIIFTIGICLRWNGYFKMNKFNKLPFNYLSTCRSPSTKAEPNSNPIGINKEFILRKNANEYTTNPPFSKVCDTITEDGYELPLQPQPGPSGFSSKVLDVPSNTSSIRSIKPRRNDPLPPTPLEMRAALHRKNSYLYDHYVNQPSCEKNPKENASTNSKNEKLPSTRCTNSERIYANC